MIFGIFLRPCFEPIVDVLLVFAEGFELFGGDAAALFHFGDVGEEAVLHFLLFFGEGLNS